LTWRPFPGSQAAVTGALSAGVAGKVRHPRAIVRYVNGAELYSLGRKLMAIAAGALPGESVPRRVRQEEIEAVFGDGWRIDEIKPATLEVTAAPAGVRAWRTAVTRV
jgi:hypothetical protein